MLHDMQRKDAAVNKILQTTLDISRPAYRMHIDQRLLGVVVQDGELYGTNIAALKDAFLVFDANIALAPLAQGGFEVVLSRVTWPWER